MADMKEQVLGDVDETITLLEKLQADLLRMHDILEHKVHDKLARAQLLVSTFKNPEEQQKAEQKALRDGRRALRKLRTVVRDAHSRIKEFIQKANALAATVYIEYNPGLRQAVQDLRVYDGWLVEILSWKQGHLAKEFEKEGASSDTVLVAVNSALNDLLSPLLAEVKKTLESLTAGRPVVEKQLIEDRTFMLDLDTALENNGVKTALVTVLVDTSVARKIEEERLAEKKMVYAINLPADIQIPERVYWEMTHRPAGKKAALVPIVLATYFLDRLHAKLVNIVPKPEDVEKFTAYWQQETRKGQRASSEEVDKFKKSGDIHLLVLAIQRHEKPVVILSNDSDIYHLLPIIRQKDHVGKDVRVFSYAGKGVLEQTA